VISSEWQVISRVLDLSMIVCVHPNHWIVCGPHYQSTYPAKHQIIRVSNAKTPKTRETAQSKCQKTDALASSPSRFNSTGAGAAMLFSTTVLFVPKPSGPTPIMEEMRQLGLFLVHHRKPNCVDSEILLEMRGETQPVS
jgi:hypothetical protein